MNIIYCRKSSEDGSRQVLSIDSQKTNLLELAARDNLSVDKIFVESMSAKQPGRPEFEKMITLIEKHPGCILFVWKLDRLARNPVDEGKIKWLLQQKTISKIITPDRIYLPEDNALISAVEFGMANQYLRDLASNVKRGLETKLKNGGYTGKAPFGYLNDPTGLKGEKKVFVDPVRSPYVEKIFRLFATGGYSLKDTAAKMYDDGLRTKSGKKIHPSLLFRMITNPFYTGVMVRHGQHYQGNHTPLVSPELYQDCQRVLSGNRSKKQHLMFPLRGFVSCPLCGCMITASLRKGHQYYHCTDGKGKHKQQQEAREHFRSEVLNKEVAKKLKDLQFDERQVEIMYKASVEKNKQDDNFLENAKIEILNSLKSLTQKRARTEDVFIDGSLPKDRYEARILDLNNQETALTNQLKQLELKSKAYGLDTIGQTKKAFLTAIYAEKNFLCGDDNQKRELAEILLSDVLVKDQKIQQIQFKPAFQRMYLSPKKLDFGAWSG
ncbi:MAG: recombinase family protein, partial [Legionella sp.]|uniref:recombinase family protein n=1 Tax=Legionella sp. TaxID=459 RepID=UPI002841022F|nr:recombinase family protein [Legionella sp.]